MNHAKDDQKISSAMRVAAATTQFSVRHNEDSEALYKTLNENGYQWDSKQGEWLFVQGMAADPPAELIRVRVWADAAIVERLANVIIQALEREGLTIQERSDPYPCRPPKQLESRIYITAIPPHF